MDRLTRKYTPQAYKPQKVQFYVYLHLPEIVKVDELAEMANIGQGNTIAHIVEWVLNNGPTHERLKAEFGRIKKVQKGVANRTFPIQCRLCLEYVVNIDMEKHMQYHRQKKIALPLIDMERC